MYNPFLIFLIVIAAIILWCLLSFVFLPLGKYIYRIFKDIIDILKKKG